MNWRERPGAPAQRTNENDGGTREYVVERQPSAAERAERVAGLETKIGAFQHRKRRVSYRFAGWVLEWVSDCFW
jgi:hypothetical protein